MKTEAREAPSGLRELCLGVIVPIGVFAGHYALGLNWATSAFLALPLFGLFAGAFNNDGQRIAKNGILLVLFPVASACALALADKCLASIGSVPDYAAFAVMLAASAAVYAIVSLLSRLASKALGEWRLPAAAHMYVVKCLAAVAYIALLLGFLVAVRKLDSVLTIPRTAIYGVRIVAAISFAVAFRKMLAMNACSVLAGSPSAGNGATEGIRLATRPSTTFADVVGMGDVKSQIRLRLVEPVRDPEKARRYGLKVGGGMLLYGPPGTGKTMLARAVAGELGLPFYAITSANVFGKYVGQSERNIKAIFAEARKNKLSVVFIDEMENLFPKRSEDSHETTRRVVSFILQELDGIDQTKNPILLIGATNVPWMIDEAFLRPGRFDIKVFVGLPDEEAREGLFRRSFAEGSIPCQNGLTEYMAQKTQNYSGADIKGVVGAMRQIAYDRGLPSFTRTLADEAIASTSPSSIGDMLDRIHEWEAENLPSNSDNSGSAGARLSVMPDTTLADVAGMDDVKEQISLRLIEPVRNQTIAGQYGLRPGGGVLLYGPPGTGKTMLARAVAGELKIPFYAITAADVFGKYVGDSERNIRKIFRDARKNDLSVVFIDELEALVPNRASDMNEVSRKVVSVLLQELDGIDKRKNPMLLLGATNVPWMVDEAFLRPGRLDVRIFVGLPDRAARKQIFTAGIAKSHLPLEDGLCDILADATDGFSGADIKGVVERLLQVAYIKRAPALTGALAKEAAASIRPSASGDILARIREWENSVSI